MSPPTNPLEEVARRLVNYEKRLSHLERLEGGAWNLIEDIHLAAPQASFDFQNIPATYIHLKILLRGRNTGAVTGNFFNVTFNNDGGNNYDYYRILRRAGAADVAGEGIAVAFMQLGVITGTAGPANSADQHEIQIFDYTDANLQKSARGEGTLKQVNAAGEVMIFEATGYWRSIVAINRITITPGVNNFDTNSRASLYGVS